MKRVTIYTDGACEGNPGPGGFAAIIEEEGETRDITGGEPRTTPLRPIRRRRHQGPVVNGLQSGRRATR